MDVYLSWLNSHNFILPTFPRILTEIFQDFKNFFFFNFQCRGQWLEYFLSWGLSQFWASFFAFAFISRIRTRKSSMPSGSKKVTLRWATYFHNHFQKPIRGKLKSDITADSDVRRGLPSFTETTLYAMIPQKFSSLRNITYNMNFRFLGPSHQTKKSNSCLKSNQRPLPKEKS